MDDAEAAALRDVVKQLRQSATLREARFETIVEELNGEMELRDATAELLRADLAAAEEALEEAQAAVEREERFGARMEQRVAMLTEEMERLEADNARLRSGSTDHSDALKRATDYAAQLEAELRSVRLRRSASGDEMQIKAAAERIADGMVQQERLMADAQLAAAANACSAIVATAGRALLEAYASIGFEELALRARDIDDFTRGMLLDATRFSDMTLLETDDDEDVPASPMRAPSKVRLQLGGDVVHTHDDRGAAVDATDAAA